MQMQVLVDTCQVLKVNDEQNDRDYVFYLSGNKIPNAKVVRNLGLVSFDEHCLTAVKELSCMFHFIFKNFKKRNIEFLLRL